MQVPRLEEQYLRSARGIVRQKEMDANAKEIMYKKMDSEVKSLSFYKNKVKVLEETVHRQKQENENLSTQARVNLSKYLAIVDNHNQSINRPKSAGAFPSTGSKRPISAPPGRLASTVDSVKSVENGSQSNSSSKRRSSTLQRTGSDLHKSIEEINATELVKLREQNERKDNQIVELSRKLSYARAYPLRSAFDTETVSDASRTNTSEAIHGISFRSKKLSSTDRKDGTVNPQDFFNDLDDIVAEDFGDEYEEKEKELEESRLEYALNLQRDFNDRILRRKAANSPHIQAIRKSRTFAQSIND